MTIITKHSVDELVHVSITDRASALLDQGTTLSTIAQYVRRGTEPRLAAGRVMGS